MAMNDWYLRDVRTQSTVNNYAVVCGLHQVLHSNSGMVQALFDTHFQIH